MKKNLLVGITTFVIISGVGIKPSSAGMDWLKKQIGSTLNAETKNLSTTKFSETKIASGLKEALKVGVDKAIELAGKMDGFNKNPDIKINMPEKLSLADKALRAAGFGPKLDEFVLSMNRAAEKAAPLAKETFVNSIMDMNIEDAQKILKGGGTSATEYFKGKTRQKLTELVQPVISQKLSELDVVHKYNDIIGQYKSLPFSSKFPAPDINDYVVNKALDGIFHLIGQQEALIRQDPTARVTGLLKEVFQ